MTDHPAVSLVTDIKVSNWGRDVAIECLDDPLTRRRYKFIFTDCQELRWSPDDSGVTSSVQEADIIGFVYGQGQNKKPAILTTDLFELSLRYGHLEVKALSPESEQVRRPIAAAGD